jgi:DNA polymerase
LSDRADAARELAELTRSVRAFVEWHEMTGTDGLPLAGRLPVVESDSAAAGHDAEADPRPEPLAAPAAPERRAPPAQTTADLAPARAPNRARAEPLAAAADDDRVTHLALLAERTRGCDKCVLCQRRKQAVFSRGDPFAELCFIGEGPGADEDALGEPFVGKAGQLLDRMIAAMGYARDDVYICNVVKCRPPENRKPEPDEVAACMPYLHEQIARVQPKAIVALGASAVQGLVGTSEGITRLRGKWKLYKGTIPVMPTFHPAYVLRQPAAKREVWDDLQEVMRILGRARPR